MKENSIEEDIKIIEKMIKSYKEADKCGLSNNDFKHEINALEHILSDYKKIKEEFKQIDHECSRLEEKEVKLENKINTLKDKMVADKMEQFDDYVIYLIEKYLNILEE